jgi:hypothetical protein
MTAAISAANDALGAIKNGPLGDVTSELCWNCNAAAACSIDEARRKITAAMEDLRQALDSATATIEEKADRTGWRAPKKALPRAAGRGALGFADE